MVNNTKYELVETDTKTTMFGQTLYRIRALKDFGDVSEGDLGGYIQEEGNLSVYGNAWVYGDAAAYGNARVSGNALVSGYAQVFGEAQVSGDAQAFGNAWVHGEAWVSGVARIFGEARVSGKLKISSGHFFGMRYNDEEIKEFEIADGIKILYKGVGDPRLGGEGEVML